MIANKAKKVEGTKYSAIKVNGLKFIKNVKVLTKADKVQEIEYVSKKILDLNWEIKMKSNSIVALTPAKIEARINKVNLMKEYKTEIQGTIKVPAVKAKVQTISK